MTRRTFWIGASVYVAIVATAAAVTGPTVIRGADGLEIMPLMLLGLPCSIVLMLVGAWAPLPFGGMPSDVGVLAGLIAGSVANMLALYVLHRRAQATVAPGGQC